MFFYISGIYNPSSGTTFSFNLKFITSASFVTFESINTLSLTYTPPPKPIELNKVTVGDNNILTTTTYSLTLQSYNSLPATSSTRQDYELSVTFPSSQYPAFTNYRTPISYTLPAGLSPSAAFNFKSSIYISSPYPDLLSISPFVLTLSNITNPPTTSNCLSSTSTFTSIEVAYLSREASTIYAKTFPALDQQNCIPFIKTRFAIEISAPFLLSRGLSYPITIQVEEPATGLTLTPYSAFLVF